MCHGGVSWIKESPLREMSRIIEAMRVVYDVFSISSVQKANVNFHNIEGSTIDISGA